MQKCEMCENITQKTVKIKNKKNAKELNICRGCAVEYGFIEMPSGTHCKLELSGKKVINTEKNSEEEKMKKYKAFFMTETFTGYPYLIIGHYYEYGCGREFEIAWDDSSIDLKIADNAWEILSEMPELIQLLAELGRNRKKPSAKEFAEMLEEMGYKDDTGGVGGRAGQNEEYNT